MKPDDYLSPKQTARLAGVDVSTIYRWVRSGVLPAYRRGPHRLVIRREDVDNLLQPVTPALPVILPADRAREAAEALRRRGYVVN